MEMLVQQALRSFVKRSVRTLSFGLFLGIIAISLVNCSRDPNLRKKKYLESAQHYFESGKLDQAVVQFRNSLEIDANFAEAHYGLGLIYLRKQNWPRAVQELNRAIDLQPENYAARVELAKLLIAGGSFEQAKEQVDWVLRTRPNDGKSHEAAADLLAAQSSFPAALQEAEKAVSLSPNDAGSYTKLGLMQLRNGQAEVAETSFRKAIDLDPKATGPRLMLANYYQVRSRFPEAEQQLRDAIHANPQDPEPTAALARLYLAEGRTNDAEALLIQNKSNFGDNSVAYRMLGDFYLGTQDLEKATTEYRKLYQDHPKDAQVKKNFIDLLIHTNRLEEAAKVNGEILKADPNDTDGLIYLGQLQAQNGDAKTAISTLQTAIKNDPNNGMAHYYLSVAFQKSGNLESAESELRNTIRLRPDLVDAQRDLGILAMRRGDMTTLAQTSSQIVALRPMSVEGYALRAVSEINRKEFAAAESDVRRALEVAPTSPAGYVQMGNLNFAQQHFKEAESAYRSALDRDPRSNDALRGLMNTYVARQQVDAAIAAAQIQISKVQDSSGFYDLLGTVLFRQKIDLAGAKDALAMSVKLDKNNVDALTKLGEVETAAGQTEEAVVTYETAAKDNPQEAGFHLSLGYIFQSRLDWVRAEEEYQRALALRHDDPIASCNLAYVIVQKGGDLDVALSLAQTARRRMPTSADAADTLGWIYYQKRAYSSAVDTLRAAVALAQESKSPDNPRYHYHLGMAYSKSGERVLAREQLQRMLRMNPDSSDASDARKELATFKS